MTAYRNFSSRLDIPDIKFIPISALLGDNVVDTSDKMPWYDGGTLLSHLEEVHVGGDRNLQDCRFPIQYVIRPQIDGARDFRGYAGRIASGVFKVGDEVVALPSGMQSRVKEIFVGNRSVDSAFPPQSVAITLETDIDLSRGDMLVRANNQPESVQELDAQVCWMGEQPLNPGIRYIVRHGTTEIKSMIREVLYKVDINTLHRNEEDKAIGMNDIARIRLAHGLTGFGGRLPPQPHDRLVHPHRPGHQSDRRRGIHQLIAHDLLVHRPTRPRQNNPRTKPSLSTCAPKAPNRSTWTGTILRALTSNADYSRAGREANIRRAQTIAHYLQNQGRTVVVSLVAPYRDIREELKAHAEVTEVYVHTTEQRGREEKHAKDYEPPFANFIAIDTTGTVGGREPTGAPQPTLTLSSRQSHPR